MSSSPYQEAANFVQEVWKKRCSVKKVLYDRDGTMKCNKATYACVCNVVKQERLLKDVLEKCRFPTQSVKNEALLYVLLYELLLGVHRDIRGGGGIKRILMKHKHALGKALADIQPQTTSSNNVNFPRYARINTLVTDLATVTARLRELQVEHYLDRHVPDLLVLPRSATEAIQTDKILSKSVILQDKSSCFSALCLVYGFDQTIPTTATVLDACAAPGNKTSHVAMLFEGKVLAYDRSEERLRSLKKRLEQMLPEHRTVTTQHADFLQQTMPTDIQAILLDPSCSGSGIYTSVDRQNDQEDAEDRIQKLSNFQFTMLHHALQASHVDRVVYSTCSIHVEENEQVIAQIMEKHRDEWQLVAPKCLATWSRRGVECPGLDAEEQAALIRVNQDDDTNGFFVACLKRRSKLSSPKGVSATPCSYSAPVKAHGVTLYDGQFSQPSHDSKPLTAVAPKPSSRPSNPGTVTAVKPKKTKINAKANSNGQVPNKVLKKRAWKARQLEAKRQRLETKTSK